MAINAFCFTLCFTLFLATNSLCQAIPLQDFQLIWQDEFSGKQLDLNKWNYRGLGKRGDAVNDPRAVFLDGTGHLVIEARLAGDKLLAGMISTENLFETKFGYFECKVKLTELPGVWPAFWLQSKFNGENGTPEKQGAEIDIFEYFPHQNKNSVSHTIHWGGYGSTHQVFGPFYSTLKATVDGFHVFGLEWNAAGYAVYVDGIKTQTGNTHISLQPEFLILSLEANVAVAGPLDHSKLPVQFIVDYVRVYKSKTK